MKTKLFCLMAAVATLVSCNVTNPYPERSGFGEIIAYSSSTMYLISTDKFGEITPYSTNIVLKPEDVGKRIYIKYYERVKPEFMNPGRADIFFLSTVDVNNPYIQSEIDAMPIEERQELLAKLGATPVAYTSMDFLRGYLNFEFETLSDQFMVPNGYSSLVWLDTESTETKSVYKWTYKVNSSNATMITKDVVSFSPGESVGPNTTHIEIRYLDLVTGSNKSITYKLGNIEE